MNQQTIARGNFRSRPKAWLWVAAGVPLIAVAAILHCYVIGQGSYAPLLFSALALLIIADCCLLQAFRSGGVIVRILGVIFLLPSVPLLRDFVIRKPWVAPAGPEPIPPSRTTTLELVPKFEQADYGKKLLLAADGHDFEILFSYRDHQGIDSPAYPFELDPAATYTFVVEETFSSPGDIPPPLPLRYPDEKVPRNFLTRTSLVRVGSGNEILYDRERCEVHHVVMERREVPIQYGLHLREPGRQPGLQEFKTLFPHHSDEAFGGCCVGPEKTEVIYICPECRSARGKWDRGL